MNPYQARDSSTNGPQGGATKGSAPVAGVVSANNSFRARCDRMFMTTCLSEAAWNNTNLYIQSIRDYFLKEGRSLTDIPAVTVVALQSLRESKGNSFVYALRKVTQSLTFLDKCELSDLVDREVVDKLIEGYNSFVGPEKALKRIERQGSLDLKFEELTIEQQGFRVNKPR